MFQKAEPEAWILKLKKGEELGKEYIHLDIANAKADWVQIKKLPE